MNSPFARAKFEEATQHIYFLPTEVCGQLENARPTVLFGSRGSGKTTLLRAMDWKERIGNQTLLQQLGNNPFRGRFIGVYTKLSEHACKSLDLLHAAGTSLEGMLFGFYLDLLAIEMIADAVSNLISEGVFVNEGESLEPRVAQQFVSSWANLLEWSGTSICRTVRDISIAAAKIREKIEWSPQRAIGPSELAKQIRIPAIGAFARSISGHLADICNKYVCTKSESSEAWHFKVCLDEAEVLSEQQRLVVNTLIRVAAAPLFPLVSYVSRPSDLSQTLIPGLTLQKADMQQISLDSQSPAEFRQLAEGVATARCQFELRDTQAQFQTATSLGKLSLNQLVHEAVSKSESQIATVLTDLASNFEGSWETRSDGEFPMYWQAFLADRLALTPPPAGTFKGKRQQESAEFRKKMVVAYLAICRLLGKRNVPYAFAEMVLGISDGCIRDFLSQLHQIFVLKYPDTTHQNLRHFLSTTVHPRIQEEAIRRVSEQKRDSIPRSGVLRPVQIGRMIHGLAEVTAKMQSLVDFAERGVFQLRGGNSHERQQAAQLVLDAVEAGFLRLNGKDESVDPLDGFRVHASLAPAYGFSYRGAYYDVVISMDRFHKLLECPDERSLAEIVESLTKIPMATSERQLLLFDEGQADEGEK
jgi:hypothetical protein